MSTRQRLRSIFVPVAAVVLATQPVQAGDLTRLQELLLLTPEGGWVKASVGALGSAFPTGADRVPDSYGHPSGIVRAWSSAAWDSANGNLLLWGGGHANYGGNEIYVWDAASGNWSLGSLPSRLDASQPILPVVGNGAPQSAHTYDGNAFLAVNQMFVTFGGAAFPDGGSLKSMDGPTGPWLWDAGKADGAKVGGGDGSGWDASRSGGNMWLNRYDAGSGAVPQAWVYVTTATRVEDGMDVVYLTADDYPTGFPSLYRYQVGDVRNGGADQWERVGYMLGDARLGFAEQGVGLLDTANNLYIRSGNRDADMYDDVPSKEHVLIVWDLDDASADSPARSTAVRLVDEYGAPFLFNTHYSGIDFDSASNRIAIWSGLEDGTVYSTQAQFGSDGKMLDTWIVRSYPSSTVLQPTIDTLNGVLGKWDYVPALGAFIAVEEWSDSSNDAAVWLYRPWASSAAPAPVPVPEPGVAALVLLGVLGVAGTSRRRLRSQGA